MAKPVNMAELRPSVLLEGKNILLSGTTGFLGKVVLSLLLARYPKIGKVYALIRPGVSERARERFNKTVAPSPALQAIDRQYRLWLGYRAYRGGIDSARGLFSLPRKYFFAT